LILENKRKKYFRLIIRIARADLSKQVSVPVLVTNIGN